MLLVLRPKLPLEWVGLLLGDGWSVDAATDPSLVLGAGYQLVVLGRELASKGSDAGVNLLDIQVAHFGGLSLQARAIKHAHFWGGRSAQSPGLLREDRLIGRVGFPPFTLYRHRPPKHYEGGVTFGFSSSSIIYSRITNFWILPVTVIGKESTIFT